MAKKKNLTNKELEKLGVPFEKKYNYLLFKGDYYSWMAKDGKPILVKRNKRAVEKKIKKAEKMAKKLKEGLNGEKLLVEALMSNMDEIRFEKLYKNLFKSKRQYKPKTREHHCVDMKVGGMIIPLVD